MEKSEQSDNVRKVFVSTGREGKSKSLVVQLSGWVLICDTAGNTKYEDKVFKH